jgi:acrylyl-CoA reductase (NADPH)
VYVDNEKRRHAWDLIARCINQEMLASMVTEIGLSEVISYCPLLLDGKVRGRTVVDVNR